MEERKLATVLFADLVGSTEFGEQDPERARVFFDRFYDAMAEEVVAAGGTVEKFAGDAVLAAFGAPAALEGHAGRALHAALAMLPRLEELSKGQLALRIGVNTGELVVATPREGSAFVTGDAVNVAARLEQAAAPGEVLVGERTAAAARGAFEIGEPMTVEVKGKKSGVVCHRLARALTLARPRGLAGLRRAFVGREQELEALCEAFASVCEERKTRFVTVLGDAGIGKTRLVRELWEVLGARTPQPLRRTGRCLPYGRGITYWPLGEILKEQFEIRESDPPERVRERTGPHRILTLTVGLGVGKDLHPLEARDRLHEGWVHFFEVLSAERPAVVLIEDLHWAEEPLLELLGRIARECDGPLLLLGTARPELHERRWPWATGRASTLELQPLGSDDSRQMIDELLSAELPATVRQLIIERAEGNPFFVEEVIESLIDHRALTYVNGEWTVSEPVSGFSIPDSVQATLAARIDLLGPADKEALQVASVIGRVFWSGPIYAMLGGSEPDFRTLEERDFIGRNLASSMAGEREFSFKHALTREVAYSTLPRARRGRLQGAFATWLERVGEGREEHAPLLAHHYAEAVSPEYIDLAWADDLEQAERLRAKAVAWLRRASELAVGRYDIDNAMVLLSHALDLEQSAEQQAELWWAIGRANALKYDGEAFWTAMQKAIELSADGSAIAEMYSELALETAYRMGMWKRLPAPELVNGWIERTLELAEPGSVARARALISRVYRDHSQADAAREAVAIADSHGDPTLQLRAWSAQLDVAFAAGEYEEACLWASRMGSELRDRLVDPEDRGMTYLWGLPAHSALSRFQEARECARMHDELVRHLTPHHRLHAVALQLGAEELTAGWDAILGMEERTTRAVAANLDTPCVMNERSLLLCAIANLCRVDETRARELEERADDLGMQGYGEILDAPRLRLALLRRDLEAAERLLSAPVPLPRAHNWWYLSAAATRLDGLAAIGDQARVESEAAKFLQPGTYLEPFALRALALVRQDDALLEKAHSRFSTFGLDWHVAQTPVLQQTRPVA